MGKRSSGSGLGVAAAGLAGLTAWRLRGDLAARSTARLRGVVAAERRWSRDLAGQLHVLRERDAPLGGGEDVRDLVLRTAIELLGAEKGLLLSRTDADGDGDLDLVCAHGFEHDPEHDPVAQRFARAVLERDETVREDDPPAGSELHCLVAVPLYLRDRFNGVVICGNRPGGFAEVQDDVLLALGDHAGAALQAQQLHRHLRDVHRGALRQLVALLEASDPRRAAMASEAATLAAALASRLGMDSRERDATVAAATVADLGMLAIPATVLERAGPLTREERAAMQRHPVIAFDVLGQVPDLRDTAFAVLYHHERPDGAGYPSGLTGKGIPRTARVVSAVTAFSAMTHDRSYSDALTAAEAARELVAGAGSQFDDEVVSTLLDELSQPQLRSIDAGTAEAVATWLLLPDRPPPPALADGASRLTDNVTLLGGHRVLHEAAATAAAEDGTFAVLAVRLLELRAVNERDGYAAGDVLLASAARRLRRAAARAGAAAFRDGGDRLVVLAPGADEAAAQRLADDVSVEFGLGPVVALAVAARRPGQDAEAVLAAARAGLGPAAQLLATKGAKPTVFE